MVDIKYLKKLGVSSAAYKQKFTLAPKDRPPGLQRLYQQIRERIQNGRENNLKDYRQFAAIDLAYELPFNQTTQTIMQSIISRRPTPEQAREILKSWGLSEEELFLKVDAGGITKLVPNPPVFFKVLVPLVKSYATIRAAKLFNDRNKTPLLPYFPIKKTAPNQIRCEVITDLIESISTNYGYPAVLREGINQALKYGVALAFPREEWHVDRQTTEDPDGRVRDVTVREGLRYHFAHPTRQSWDLLYPLTSINTDTGCEFGFHWRVMRFGDVLDDRRYWNRNAVTFGTNWFDGTIAGNYFKEVYPCALKFPVIGSPLGELREDRVANYTSSDRESALFVTEYYAKIVPANFDLAPYKYPVWHRFTVASDDTIMWAGPCAYNPLWAMAYDYDANSARQSSFALETIPWQDHIGNILTQMMLTVRQNLINLVWYDTNMVDPKDVKTVTNLGEDMYRSIQFMPYDSLRMQKAGINVQTAFTPVQLSYRDVSQLAQMMSGALNIMERVLQMSSQEVGAAAQHYQSAKEIAVTQNATTNRLAYTGSFIDDGIDAWKKQLYEAAMAYMDTDISAQINSDLPVERLSQIFAELGFEHQFEGHMTFSVRGKKTKLKMEGFVRNDNEEARESNAQLAQVMYQTVGAVSQNPELFNMVGVENVVKLLEEAAKLSGAPATFRLRLDPNASPGGIQKQIAEMVKESEQGVMDFVSKQVMEPASKAAAQADNRLDQVEGVIKKLMGIYQMAEGLMEKNQAALAEAQQRMQIKQAEFQAEQQRKAEAHQLEMQRRMQTAQVDTAIKTQTAQSAEQIKAEQAALDAQIKASEASVQTQIEAQVAQQEAAIAAAQAENEIELKRKQSAATIENKQAESKAKAKAAAKVAAKKPAKNGRN